MFVDDRETPKRTNNEEESKGTQKLEKSNIYKLLVHIMFLWVIYIQE